MSITKGFDNENNWRVLKLHETTLLSKLFLQLLNHALDVAGYLTRFTVLNKF